MVEQDGYESFSQMTDAPPERKRGAMFSCRRERRVRSWKSRLEARLMTRQTWPVKPAEARSIRACL